jgi:hypothetical protein
MGKSYRQHQRTDKLFNKMVSFSNTQKILSETLIWVQFSTALVALFHFPTLKKSYWKWFIIYCCAIFLMEAFAKWGLKNYPSYISTYYDFFVIPIEFVFFYWLYAVKSLKRQKLFWIITGLFCISFLPYFTIIHKPGMMLSLSYTVGTVLLMFLVILEIFKQIKSEKILLFHTNYMFYINIGIMLFYVGTLPFFSFYNLLLNESNLWSNYYTFFLIANHLMYLLFTAAFIWGKPNIY